MITIPSKKPWYKKISIFICGRSQDIHWAIKREIYRWKFWFKIRKHYMAPWDVTDVIFHINFEMFIMFWEPYKQSNTMALQYGSETEEEAQVRYNEFERLYKYYTVDRKNLEKQIEDHRKSHYENFPFECQFVPTDDSKEYYTLVSKKEESAAEKESYKHMFDLDDMLYTRDVEALKDLIKHYKCFWD